MVENIRLTNSARIVGGAGFDILTCGEAGFRIAGSAVLQLDLAVQGNARIENVGKSQSCMVSKLPIIWKQTVVSCAVGAMMYGCVCI